MRSGEMHRHWSMKRGQRMGHGNSILWDFFFAVAYFNWYKLKEYHTSNLSASMQLCKELKHTPSVPSKASHFIILVGPSKAFTYLFIPLFLSISIYLFIFPSHLKWEAFEGKEKYMICTRVKHSQNVTRDN